MKTTKCLYRRRYKTVLLLWGLLCLMGNDVQNAQAQPSVYFRPVTTWDVKVLTTAQTGAKICSIASEMNNGYVLQMTAGKDGIQTLNINWRQSAFKTGQFLETTISVPGQIMQVHQSKAISPESLVIDMKDAQELYEKLKVSNVLDLSLAGKEFRFYLTGLSSRIGKFESCMKKSANATLSMSKASMSKAHEQKNVQKAIESQRVEPKAIAVQNSAGVADFTSMGNAPEQKKVATPSASSASSAQKSARSSGVDASDVNATPSITGVVVEGKLEPDDITEAEQKHWGERVQLKKSKAKVTADFTDAAIARDIKKPALELPEDTYVEASATSIKNASVSPVCDTTDVGMRYTEAQRQVKQLGMKIQTERAQCDNEKKELEGLLFDPALTEQAQLAKLGDLERSLEDAKRELADQKLQYEARIDQLQRLLEKVVEKAQ